MSHHYSGPDFGFPHGDARLNLTDLYAFPKPGSDRKSILIFNVHPSHTFDPQVPTTPVPFAPEALYELKIDTNGDAVADAAYRIRFSPFTNGAQTATLRYVAGAQAAGTGDDGQVIVDGAPVSLDREARVTEAGDYRFFAGWRSDPFFFDPLGAVNNLHFTGKDFFIEKNVCSIVLEVPNSALGPKEVGLWMRTLDGAGGSWVQADRGALPSQGVFLQARRGMLTSPQSLRTMHVSSPSSRTRWSTLAGIARRKRSGSQRHCCRTSCAMTTRARRHIRTMGGHSLTTPSITSSLSSQTGK